MGKIATEFEVKQKVNGYRTINEDKCCTKDRAVAIGANKMKLTQYEDDQLVQLDDIISGDMVHDYWWVYIQIQDYWMLEEEWDKFSSRELYEVSQTRNSGYANIIIYNEEYQTISDVPTKIDEIYTGVLYTDNRGSYIGIPSLTQLSESKDKVNKCIAYNYKGELSLFSLAVDAGAPRYVEEINHGYENEMSMYLSYLSRNVSGTISYSGLNAYDGVSNKILISSVDAMKSN